MKKLLTKIVLLTGISFFGAVLLNSCSKNDGTISSSPGPTPIGTPTSANNLLNRDLVVPYAKDDGAVITAKFAGLTFRFTSNGTLTGSATAANDLLAVNGTWSMTAAYDKVTFAFPTNIFPDLAFMNKEWVIGSNGSTVVLIPSNGENDLLDFSAK